MKKILTAILTLGFSLSPIHAADYDTTHTFAAGDIISADMMNEVLNELEYVTKVATEADFIGSWDLVQTVCKGGKPSNCSAGNTMTGMSNDTNGITKSRSDVVTFANDGDGTFSFSQTNYASFILMGDGNSAGSGDFAIVNGLAVFKDSTHGLGNCFVKKISPTRMLVYSTGLSEGYNTMLLDKRLGPPAKPTGFAIATTGLSNVLTWTDNSSDETGFKVYRKLISHFAIHHQSWVLIDNGAGMTLNANIVTYTDTVSAAGDYLYRVKASNINNEDSVGSKVVKTTNTN